jgi:hypothetical protein
VAEVGAGVVGEQHGDEAKLVAWSAGPGNDRRCRADGVGSVLVNSCGDGLVVDSSMPGHCSGR